MSRISRREFLEQSMIAAAATAAVPSAEALARPSPARLPGPNEILRLAVCGVKGRGSSHVGEFSKMPDVHVAAICDVDESVIDRVMATAQKGSGKKPAYYKDFRKLMEDKSIDAVSVATTNHTHTLISIHAVLAGKHVYVEKPLSHNVWEGRQLVTAARKHKRIVQHGTQSRSEAAWKKAIAYVQAGKIGKVKVSRGLCYKRRVSIGHTPEGPAPASADYDLWLGPAPLRPYSKNRFHYNWHWHWDYGNGDIGNQGVHQMDLARWALGKTLPVRVVSAGGRFGYEDDGETPNTQIVCMDYGDSQLIFEVRGLETEKYMGAGVGNIVHGSDGHIVGTSAFDKDGRKVEINGFDAKGENHFGDFVDAIRTGTYTDLNADVLDGHLSSALCHLGNISYRLGELRPITRDDPFGDNAEGNEAFRRMREHLSSVGVDLSKTQLKVGRTLKFDPVKEKFIGDAEADRMLTREYRRPFVVPDGAM